MSLTKAALRYLKEGFSLIPVAIDKKPLVNWKNYQYKHPTKDEIKEWFKDPKARGIAIITGKISNLAVLDFEKGADIPKKKLKEGIRSRSGGGGRHYYFRYPAGLELQSCTRLLPEMDLRAEGGYIIAPPSDHKSGNKYEWIDDIFEYKLSQFPEWIMPKYRERRSVKGHIEEVISGVNFGNRNESATRVIGTLMTYVPYFYWEPLLWPLVVAWNNNNKPPMGMSELRQVYRSIGRRALKNHTQRFYLKQNGHN